MARAVAVFRDVGKLARQCIKSRRGLRPSRPRASSIPGTWYISNCGMYHAQATQGSPAGMACLRTAVVLHALHTVSVSYIPGAAVRTESPPCRKHGHGNVTILLLRVAVNIQENL